MLTLGSLISRAPTSLSASARFVFVVCGLKVVQSDMYVIKLQAAGTLDVLVFDWLSEEARRHVLNVYVHASKNGRCFEPCAAKRELST